MTPGLLLPGGLLPIANHLGQSTLFAGIAGLLTPLLRNNRAHARYCLWLAASLAFRWPNLVAGGEHGDHGVSGFFQHA